MTDDDFEDDTDDDESNVHVDTMHIDWRRVVYGVLLYKDTTKPYRFVVKLSVNYSTSRSMRKEIDVYTSLHDSPDKTCDVKHILEYYPSLENNKTRYYQSKDEEDEEDDEEYDVVTLRIKEIGELMIEITHYLEITEQKRELKNVEYNDWYISNEEVVYLVLD